MKQIALHIILFSYCMAMLKPVAPYITDAVAHIFYYSQHIATVHYENGKMHVHREIVNDAEKDQPVKELPVAKKNDTTSDHIVCRQTEKLQMPAANKARLVLYPAKLPFSYLAAEYPPPKA